MRTFFRGDDGGGAAMIALGTLFALSLLFLSLASLVSAKRAFSERAMASVLEENRRQNGRWEGLYDLH